MQYTKLWFSINYWLLTLFNLSGLMMLVRRLIVAIGLSSILVNSSFINAQEFKLPSLGESSTSLFSSEFEYQLGRAWLRAFRGQVPTIDDPLLFDYVENLIYKLASYSKLEDRRIELVIVDNPTMNAFAVPGGVIGIHNGLLLWAQTEDEFATVLAHEIAHLSQRHFSRGVEYQQKMQPLTLAAMLASFVLMATTGADVGMAALSATQAAAQGSALSYSRSNEQEADRVGMQTIVDAGMDPHAAPVMFERMLRATRYTASEQTPEFLRSHPLSENRIADTRNRARKFPKKVRPPNLNYQLMRARVINELSETPELAVARFQGELDGTPFSREAATYGLVIALTAAGRADEAGLKLSSVWSTNPDRLEYIIADADIDMALNQPAQAAKKLARRLAVSPGNHPLTMSYARALMKNQQPHIAAEVLAKQSRSWPDDPGLWYLLAEVQGLSGDILGLHESRAEYFILRGSLDSAEKQLNYALKLSQGNYLVSAKVNQRLADVRRMQERMEEF